MAVITQNYDIDLESTGEYPVVKMSQFDTGSRTIVFTVYDGHELAKIDGMVARVDGTRSDGVEFSVSCTVGTGSKVSFTISQEMTKHAGKHAAELVIFDKSGNPIGTQNFIIEVEAAPMVRDSAASADDRTLFDQYTDSVEAKFNSLSTSLTDTLTAKTDALTKTVQDIDALLGGSSTARTIINQNVTINGSFPVHVVLGYDPVSGMVALNVSSDTGLGGVSAGTYVDFKLVDIPKDYLPEADKFGGNENLYQIMSDGYQTWGTAKDWGVDYLINTSGSLFLRVLDPAGAGKTYSVGCSAAWFARGGRYMGVTPIPTGSNTVTVGTTTTVQGGSQASVTNSGTAKDVVLDFEIPTQSFEGEGEESISISAKGDSSSAGRNAIAIGKNASASYAYSVVIGPSAKDIHKGSGSSCTIIGSAAMGALSAVSIGMRAGTNNGSPAECHGVSVGNESLAYNSRSVALGGGARATGSDDYHASVALGGQAVASGVGSVALGDTSKAAENYVVSVGQGSGRLPYSVATRRIINVTDPVNAQDAATKAYVDSHAASGGYTLPAATASTLGGVKVGDNLTVSDDGTLAATAYTLPAATTSTLGGVRVGDNLTVSDDGTLSTIAYTLPAATATTLGGVKVGSGLTVASDGVVSARTYGSFGDAYTKIAIGLSSSSGLLCLGADPQSFMQKDLDNDGKRYSLALKPATASTVGGVKIGAGINVSSDGTIDVQALVDRIAALESKVAALEAK